MSDNDKPDTEARILHVMKRVLTDIARETYTRPGYRHPLSPETVENMRQCLALISAREGEINAAAGRPMNDRPRFIDEPQSAVVVSLDLPDKTDKDD